MSPDAFHAIVAEEFPRAIPERFVSQIHNVAFLVEDEPTQEVRTQEGLSINETLLGYYRGIPATLRGDVYGVGATLPDSIVLYRLPIIQEAQYLCGDVSALFEERVRQVVRETIWHEVAHHFGMGEHEVRRREKERNKK